MIVLISESCCMVAKIIHGKVLSKLYRTPRLVAGFSFFLNASLWKGPVRIGAASGDSGGGVGCRCGREQNLTETPEHFASVPKSKRFTGDSSYWGYWEIFIECQKVAPHFNFDFLKC